MSGKKWPSIIDALLGKKEEKEDQMNNTLLENINKKYQEKKAMALGNEDHRQFIADVSKFDAQLAAFQEQAARQAQSTVTTTRTIGVAGALTSASDYDFTNKDYALYTGRPGSYGSGIDLYGMSVPTAIRGKIGKPLFEHGNMSKGGKDRDLIIYCPLCEEYNGTAKLVDGEVQITTYPECNHIIRTQKDLVTEDYSNDGTFSFIIDEA